MKVGLKNSVILVLLEKATRAAQEGMSIHEGASDAERTNFVAVSEIQSTLANAADSSLQFLVEALYAGAIEERPDALLGLYPFFSAACGERENGILRLARVDWRS